MQYQFWRETREQVLANRGRSSYTWTGGHKLYRDVYTSGKENCIPAARRRAVWDESHAMHAGVKCHWTKSRDEYDHMAEWMNIYCLVFNKHQEFITARMCNSHMVSYTHHAPSG